MNGGMRWPFGFRERESLVTVRKPKLAVVVQLRSRAGVLPPFLSKYRVRQDASSSSRMDETSTSFISSSAAISCWAHRSGEEIAATPTAAFAAVVTIQELSPVGAAVGPPQHPLAYCFGEV